MLIAPERQNTDFKWEGFAEAVNKDLLGALGNLVNRVVTFLNQHFEGKIGPVDKDIPEIKDLIGTLEKGISDYVREMDAYEFQKTVVILRDLWQEGNKFFQLMEPWKLVKEDKEKAHVVLSAAAHYVRAIAILSEPFIPKTAEKIFGNLGLEPLKVHELTIDEANDFDVLSGVRISEKPVILFKKIEKKQVQELIKRFGGREEKKEKKKKKKKKAGEAEKPGIISYDEFSRLDIRIGEIKSAEKIEGSDTLLKLRVDIGSEVRTIVSGIGHLYKPEEIVGKKTPVLVNLKPKKLKGIMSEGMLLMTGSDDLGWFFLVPEKDVPPGTKIM